MRACKQSSSPALLAAAVYYYLLLSAACNGESLKELLSKYWDRKRYGDISSCYVDCLHRTTEQRQPGISTTPSAKVKEQARHVHNCSKPGEVINPSPHPHSVPSTRKNPTPPPPPLSHIKPCQMKRISMACTHTTTSDQVKQSINHPPIPTPSRVRLSTPLHPPSSIPPPSALLLPRSTPALQLCSALLRPPSPPAAVSPRHDGAPTSRSGTAQHAIPTPRRASR